MLCRHTQYNVFICGFYFTFATKVFITIDQITCEWVTVCLKHVCDHVHTWGGVSICASWRFGGVNVAKRPGIPLAPTPPNH